MRAFLFIVIVLALAGCCPDEPICNDPTNPLCPNFDSCLVFEAVDASFSIKHIISGVDCMDGRGQLDLVLEVDTTYSNSDLVFEALHEADSYEWHIGSDPELRHDKKFTLYFPTSIAPADIDVTLIVCKNAPQGCEGGGCDTTSRRIHLFFPDASDSTASLVIGTFKGIITDAPMDSFTIIIPPTLPSLRGIINFPNGCVDQYLEVSKGWNGFILHMTPTICQSACGIGYIQDDRNTLVIDYSIREGGQRRLKKFVGIRIK